jgi:hypothetical protein
MKVLDLRCARQHSFEGWFASGDDFVTQQSRGLIECPLCSDKNILKMPSAPRLNFGAPPSPSKHDSESTESATASSTSMSSQNADAPQNAVAVAHTTNAGPSPAAQAAFLKALRHVVVNTEDVGERFTDEARRMHYGEAKARSIRGQATAREAVELLEEGISVIPLVLPAALKETLQ